MDRHGGTTERFAKRIQRGIEGFYRLERTPSVLDFLRTSPAPGDREALFIRDAGDGALELAVRTPELPRDPDLDAVCQVIEGVSHFVYVADRARRHLPATELELELQAEIDKYVLLVVHREPFDAGRARAMHERLYERVRYAAREGTEAGDRYRLANELAARFARRIETHYLQRGRRRELRDRLARFYAMGQSDKLELARAA